MYFENNVLSDVVRYKGLCHMILFLEYSEEAKIDLWLQGLPGGQNWESPVMTSGLLLGMIVVSI